MTKLHAVSESSDHTRGDVVFVHGLGGDPFTTWKENDGASWFDWLAADQPDLNLWSLGYEIQPTAWTGAAMPLADRAVNVLAALDRAGLGVRPICFIAHSMGGLLVKQLLRHASSIAKEYRHICGSTRGVVFLSTPHAGSDVANLVSYLGFFLRTTVAVAELQAHEPRLRELNLWYRNNVADLDIGSKVFYETKATRGIVVVNATSADPGIPGVVPIPVDADHLDVCHPRSPDDVRYVQIVKFLNDRVPVSRGTEPPSPELRISALRQRLLAADSRRELRRLLYETEQLLSNSHDPDALILRDEIRIALRYAEAPPAMAGPMPSERLEYEYKVALRPSVWTVVARILGALALIYGVYRFVSWLVAR